MKRVIWHWTGGAEGANSVELDSYHEVVQPDGTWARGDFPAHANTPPLKSGAYAAHTRNLNSYSIGIACDAMAGARERPFSWGSNPLTHAQIETMLDRTAHYCKLYNIPVSRQTTLSHAEVQPTLGVSQSAKWDITVLPGMTTPGDAVKVGDELRARLLVKMNPPKPVLWDLIMKFLGVLK